MNTTVQLRRAGLAPSVLHVIDLPGAGWDALAAAANCAAALDNRQRILLIGDGQAGRDAAAFGLAPARRLCPPLNRLSTAVGPLDLAFKELDRESPIDVVHVWSDSARVLCREALAYTFPITQEDPGRFVLTTQTCPRAAARAALGVADHETAILLASDRPEVGDARRLAGLVGILHLAEHATVGLASSRSDNFRRAARFLRGFNRDWDVIALSTPPHLSLAAADIVLYDQGDTLTADAGPGPRTGGVVVAAAAAGIPVVAVDTSLTRRLLGPLAGELLAPSGLLPDLARALVPLSQNSDRRTEVGRRLLAHLPTITSHPCELLARWLAADSQPGAAA
jgi:hypothetical protein